MASNLNEVLGWTLAEYAAHTGTSVHAARDPYRRIMRHGEGLELPPLTREARDGDVHKFCLALPSPASGPALESESVLIPMRSFHGAFWRTLCVSSQVGCRMGCTFCETARMGLVRHLTPAEIVAQFCVARALLTPGQPARGQQYDYASSGVRNLVFMGMGEPLDNFDALVQAIRVLSDPNGLGIPRAQITVSTVGRVDGLRRLAALNWPSLRLALSLNAADDRLRDELMPINRAMPLAELHRALAEYPLPKRGSILVEYVLLRGVNDSLADARAVAAWCNGLRCIVNLIPYNPQHDAAYETPEEERVLAFQAELRRLGILAKRRITQGHELMGACGQLGNPAIRRAARTARIQSTTTSHDTIEAPPSDT